LGLNCCLAIETCFRMHGLWETQPNNKFVDRRELKLWRHDQYSKFQPTTMRLIGQGLANFMKFYIRLQKVLGEE
jgi:hypothetical protein